MPSKMKRSMSSDVVTKKSRSHGKFGQSYSRGTSTTTKLVRELLDNQEVKYLDTWFTSSSIPLSNSGNVGIFNKIAEGTDYNQRVGRKIKGRNIQYDIRINPLLASPAKALYQWSWHLVLDRQANNAAATPTSSTGVSGIFDNSIIANGPSMFKAVATNPERFQILKSETGYLGSGLASENCHLRGMIPFQEIVQYSSSSADIPQTNALYLVAFDDDTPSTNTIGMIAGIRFTYHDV